MILFKKPITATELEQIDAEIERETSVLLKNYIIPQTLSWTIARTMLYAEVSKKYGGVFADEWFTWRKLRESFDFKESAKSWVAKRVYKIFNYRMIKILSRIEYLPYLFRRAWYYEMDGHKLFVNERDWKMIAITSDYTNKKIWEPETTKIVKENVKKGQTALDIGASIGYFTLLLARQVGETGRVVAIEPTKGNFKYLQHNIAKNGYENVRAFNIAAWDKHEDVNVMPHSPTGGILPGRPLDDVLEEIGIYELDFIKIDVDGADIKALKGLERTIGRSKNLKMTCEYYPKYLLMAGENPDDFMKIIETYFTYEVIPDDYTENCWNLYCTKK